MSTKTVQVSFQLAGKITVTAESELEAQTIVSDMLDRKKDYVEALLRAKDVKQMCWVVGKEEKK